MTEAEWLNCTDPKVMLRYLKGKASQRKLRLFAVACCRRILNQLSDERSRRTIDVLERVSDGLSGTGELTDAAQAAHEASKELMDSDDPQSAAAVANAVYAECPHPYDEESREQDVDEEEKERGCLQNALDSAFAAAWAKGNVADPGNASESWLAAVKAEESEQSDLLHDIFGNPFHPVATDAAWLTPAVTALAQTIYDERAFDRMSELADALEQAGCTDADVLEHCRGPNEHARGCWVVDLILSKE